MCVVYAICAAAFICIAGICIPLLDIDAPILLFKSLKRKKIGITKTLFFITSYILKSQSKSHSRKKND